MGRRRRLKGHGAALAIDRELDPSQLAVGLARADGVGGTLVHERELVHLLERAAPAADARALPRVEDVHAATALVARAADHVQAVDAEDDAESLPAAVRERQRVGAALARLEIEAARAVWGRVERGALPVDLDRDRDQRAGRAGHAGHAVGVSVRERRRREGGQEQRHDPESAHLVTSCWGRPPDPSCSYYQEGSVRIPVMVNACSGGR